MEESFGPVSRHASLAAATPLLFSIPRESPEDVVLGNLIRHGFVREHGPVISRDIFGMQTKHFSLLLPEIVVSTIASVPLTVPREFFADKLLVLFGDREKIVANKDSIGRDFTKYSSFVSVPTASFPEDRELTTADLTVLFAPFSGAVSVLDASVLFPEEAYLGRLDRGVAMGFALRIVPAEAEATIDSRVFCVPEYRLAGDIGTEDPDAGDRMAFEFAIARRSIAGGSFRKTVDSIVAETRDEVQQIIQHVSKNRAERPIFYGTDVPQPLRLLAETATRMGMPVGIAPKITPIQNSDRYSFDIVFSTPAAQEAFVARSSEVASAIERRLSALRKASAVFPAIDADEPFAYPLVLGKASAAGGAPLLDIDSHLDIDAYLELAETLDRVVEKSRREVAALGDVERFDVIEDYVRGVPKAAIREYLKRTPSLKFLTNAGVKIAELVSLFPALFDELVPETFLVGEMPGSFVASLIEIYGARFGWTAQSLTVGDALDDKYGFVKRFPDKWDFGPKTYGGDITNEKLQAYYTKKYAGKVSLFVSDIGTDGADRQRVNAPLYAASAELAMKVLRPGGAAVLKTFGLMRRDMVRVTLELMREFAEVHFVKPVSSSPFNLEVYVVAEKRLAKPRAAEDVSLRRLLYAATANAMHVQRALNRLGAYTRTGQRYGLPHLPRTVVAEKTEFVAELFARRGED